MKTDHVGFFSLPMLPLIMGLIVAMPSNILAMERPVGQFTVVKGKVMVTHASASNVGQYAKPETPVLFHDSVQTASNSQTKALFVDDTFLTVGENTRITIDEYVFNPHEDQRSVIVNMLQGRIRALVGKHFSGAGSRFEIHTPTAVAAARGTYFIVWTENKKTTGMVNIGQKGDVAFTSAGRMVVVKPGYYSMAIDGAAPTTPVVFTNQTAGISPIVSATDVKEDVQTDSAKVVLHAVGHDLIPATTFAAAANSTTGIGFTSSLVAGTSSSVRGAVSTGTSTVTSVITAAAAPVTSIAPTSVGTMAAIGSTVAIAAPVVTTIAAPVTSVVTAIVPTVTVAPVVPVTPPNVISRTPVLGGILH